jgi:uracil-DNA glycosylase
LRNVIQTVKNDFGDVDVNPNLESWAKQGVLLLNTALTVQKGMPASHIDMWMPFTRDVITKLSLEKPHLVWVLWGKKAQEYGKLLILLQRYTAEVRLGFLHVNTLRRLIWRYLKTR